MDERLGQLENDVKGINEKLDRLLSSEQRNTVPDHTIGSVPNLDNIPPAQQQQPDDLGDEEESIDVDYARVQQDYKAVVETVRRVQLPSALCWSSGVKGIKGRESREKAALCDTAADYLSTVARIACSSSIDSPSRDQLLRVCLAGFGALGAKKEEAYVASNFDQPTADLFQNLRDTSLFQPRSLQTLQIATDLYGRWSQGQSRAHSSNSRGGFRGYRGSRSWRRGSSYYRNNFLGQSNAGHSDASPSGQN
jgi:hypothetical protein